MERRDFLKTVAWGAGAAAMSVAAAQAPADEPAEKNPNNQKQEPIMHTLKKLPYAFDAMEPFIDARTMEIHHTKHHQTYVDKLNAALEKYPSLQSLPIEKLIADLTQAPEGIRTAVRNNGGGVVNHDLFFGMLTPKHGGLPVGKLAAAIDATFGGFEAFQQKFAAAAAAHFASGWAWLSLDPNGKLLIETTPGHDTPLMSGRRPILVLDVWEHAYYLKHQNRRPDSIAAWWHVLDWEHAERNFTG
jgi:superoxide dismutase, Fe-Mn family